MSRSSRCIHASGFVCFFRFLEINDKSDELRLISFGFFFLVRLWHQLTKKLFEFFDVPAARPYRVDVFERFVRDFESKINQLRLAEMGVKVAKDIDSAFFFFLPCTIRGLSLTCDLYFFVFVLFLFCRSSNPLDVPHVPRLKDRHESVERGACVVACFDCAC